MNTDASENPSDLSKISDCQLMAMNELEQYCEQRIKSLSLPNSHSQESATRNENLAVDGATRTAIANPFDQVILFFIGVSSRFALSWVAKLLLAS